MGYTNYWIKKKPFNNRQWNIIKKEYDYIKENFGVNNANEYEENIIEDQNLNFEVPQSVRDIFAKEALIMPDTYFFSDAQDLKKVLNNSKLFLDEYLNNAWKEKSKNNLKKKYAFVFLCFYKFSYMFEGIFGFLVIFCVGSAISQPQTPL